MTQAVRLVVEHAQSPVEDGGLGLERVTLRADVRNLASRAVAERAGLVPLGTAHAVERGRDGALRDFVLHERVAPGVC